MEEENYFCLPIGRWYQSCPINPLSVVTFFDHKKITCKLSGEKTLFVALETKMGIR